MKKTLFLLSLALVSATCLQQAAAEETTYTQENWPTSSEVKPAPTDGGNTITVSGVNDSEGNVYGGYANDGSAVENNHVLVENSSTMGYVTGGEGRGTDALVRENSATISGSTATEVYAGYTDFGTCRENTATVTDKAVVESVYGAQSGNTGNCEGNTAEVKGASTVTSDVQGAFSVAGSTDNNIVNISEKSQVKNVYGGVTQGGSSACGNTVTLDNATATGVVYGGYISSSDTGSTSGNRVTIRNGSTLSEHSSRVYGGQASMTAGEASNNTVTIDASSVASSVYGGQAATATGNKVIIENGATATSGYNGITGGYGTTATGNSVTIEGATVSGNVYGARAYNSKGASTASNNGIIVKAGSDLSGATLHAAGSSQSTATLSDNYLTLDGFTGTVEGIRNVDILNINLSTWDTTVVALALTDGASTLNQLTLNFNLLNWDDSASGEMTLVSGLKEADIANWNFTTGSGTAATSADSPVGVNLAWQCTSRRPAVCRQPRGREGGQEGRPVQRGGIRERKQRLHRRHPRAGHRHAQSACPRRPCRPPQEKVNRDIAATRPQVG